jgi:secreted trypsin-like serine protease
VLLHYKTYIPNHERYLGTEENKGKQREKGLVGDSKKHTRTNANTTSNSGRTRMRLQGGTQNSDC